MQNLNIADAGFSYIFKCIGLYYEGNIYFLLYLLSLAFLCIAGDKGKEVSDQCGEGRGYRFCRHAGLRMRELFLPQFVLMILTVYNPIFPVALNTFFDVNKEYYRFLWMAPVIICTAAAGTVIVMEYVPDTGHCGDSSGGGGNGAAFARQLTVTVFILCLLVSGGSYLYKDGYIVSPNIYHMPTEIPEVSEIIHSDAESRRPDEKYPKAIFEYDYNMLIRQYDASILLACDREEYMEALGGSISSEDIMENRSYKDRLLAVMGLGIEIHEDLFVSALEHTSTEYVVVTTSGGLVPYLEDCELTIVGETANHTIFHYEPKEPQEFELPDYSEVWRLTPQVYDFLL